MQQLVRESLFLPASLLLVLMLVGCDAVYHSKISAVSSPLVSPGTARVEFVGWLESEFGLQCEATDYQITSGTYEQPAWDLLACTAGESYVDVQIASAGNRLAVEVFTVAGAHEPQGFRDLRIGIESWLAQSNAWTEVAVENPRG